MKKINEMITLGVDVNMDINKKKWTALHFAVKIKNKELAKILLLNGANPEKLTQSNKNCFHLSAFSSEKILILLLISISDYEISKKLKILNHADSKGNTPLHYFAMSIKDDSLESKNMIELMVQNGADPKLNNLENLNFFDISCYK